MPDEHATSSTNRPDVEPLNDEELEVVSRDHPRHSPVGRTYCEECARAWPCATSRIVAELIETRAKVAELTEQSNTWQMQYIEEHEVMGERVEAAETAIARVRALAEVNFGSGVPPYVMSIEILAALDAPATDGAADG